MDIKIDDLQGKFKFRVCGVLKNGEKYLAVKMNDNDFYCLPGGHIELGEDTEMAILREMKEELNFDVKINRLIAINQNFFKTKDLKTFHEIGFYYIVEAIDDKMVNKSNYEREELDKGKLQHLEFKWFTLNELKKIDFRPSFIINCLQNDHPTINITKD